MPVRQASLIFFYFGEKSYMNRLAQETVPLHLAMEGYNKSILLNHPTEVGPFKMSAKDQARATVVDIPTRENLVKYLKQLGEEGFAVDLSIFSHGTPDKFITSAGTYGDNEMISGSYLEAFVKPMNLRMVWQCNCYGATLNDTWAKLGAEASAGSRLVNFYPTRFRKFIEGWNAGEELHVALREADTKLAYTPVQAYMPADAAARLKEWDGNLFQATQVLGSGDAAERYFRKCWLGDSWQKGRSGKENMKYSSAMLIGGDGTLKRF